MGDTGVGKKNAILREGADASRRAEGTAIGIGANQQGQHAFRDLQQIAQNIGVGQLFTEDFLRLLDDQSLAQANDVATERFAEARGQIANGPGLRSGASFGADREIASGFASQVGDSARANRINVASLNRQAEIDAFNLQTSALQQALQPQRDLVNAQLGSGQGITSAGSQYQVSSPGGIIGSVLGLAGALGGAALTGGTSKAATGATGGTGGGGK